MEEPMRSWAMLFALALLAPACTKGGDDTSDTNVGDDTDTSADDTDTNDSDTDTGDTDTGPFEGVEIDVRDVEALGPDWRVAAYLVHSDGTADGALVGEREYASAAFDGSPTTLRVPDISADDVGPLFDDSTGAMFLIYAYDDADGNGHQDPTEAVVAVSNSVLLYVVDVGSAEGLTADAWQGLSVDLVSGNPFPHDLSEGFDLTSRAFQTSITVDGTVDASVEASADRLAAVSTLEFDGGGFLAGRPVDEALSDPFTATFSSPLDPTRLQPSDSLDVGVEVLMAYADDGSGDLGEGDTALGFACWDDRLVLFYYIDDVTDPIGAFVTLLYGVHPGWQAAVDDGSGGVELLSDTALGALVVYPDTTCGVGM